MSTPLTNRCREEFEKWFVELYKGLSDAPTYLKTPYAASAWEAWRNGWKHASEYRVIEE